ncbi:ZPR1 zinc finger domain-containing protein [Candidatus Woesearchaeota archaeon]|nr:ZPR1 zinc finger domain-containing protein [Candidatus Woesearchaeota archaeon]
MTKEDEQYPAVLDKQPCPMCHTKNLKLTEIKKDIPYFGTCFIFSMDCANCDYTMSDIETEEEKDPVKYSFEINSEEDLKVRVVKSSQATVKVPRMIEITPGPMSSGYVTNIEGIINRIKSVLETQRDEEDDKKARKKIKNRIKKLQRVIWGRDKLKIIIKDPSGNSAIISDKAEKSGL